MNSDEGASFTPPDFWGLRRAEEMRKQKAEKAKEDAAKLDELKTKMGVDQGCGHFANARAEGPASGMDNSEAVGVLKLLNLGCKEVNFRLAMRGEREAVRVSNGDFRLSMTVYPNESPYYPETDMIDFMLKKKGDPDFKFKAEVQLIDENGEMEMVFPDEDGNDRMFTSKESTKGFQHISDFVNLREYGVRRGYQDSYLIRINVSVL